MAFIYIEHHLDELGSKTGAQKIHEARRQATLKESLQEQLREYYLAEQYSEEGGMIPELAVIIQEQQDRLGGGGDARTRDDKNTTGFELKQSTMPDSETAVDQVFDHGRPVLVVPEATTENVLPNSLTTEYS